MCTALQIDEETLEKYFKPVKDLQAEVGVMCVLYNMSNDQLYNTQMASRIMKLFLWPGIWD